MADVFTLSRELTRLDQRVRRLEAQNAIQATQIVSLASSLKLYGAQSERAGQDMSPLATGVTPVDLVWPNPFPDTVYIIAPTIIVPAANMGQAFVEVSAKTTTGCTIAVRNTSGASITTALLDVVAIRT